jgi:GT2 family glycosyltransferase
MTGQLGDHLREYAAIRRRARRVAASSLFDASWYRQQNPDIGAADPALHYVLAGGSEGRSPGPGFDGEWYLRHHPDVAASGENPLLHYLEVGHREYREIASVGRTGLPRLALNETNYQRWLDAYGALDDARRQAIRARVAALRVPTFLSVVLLDDAPHPETLAVASRLYPNSEILADVAQARQNARGEFLIFIAAGVLLAEDALAAIALSVAATPDTDLVYADEEQTAFGAFRAAPDFKPDWDPDLALARDLIGPTGAYRRTLALQVGLPEPGAFDAFILRFTSATTRVKHVPAVLFRRGERREDDARRTAAVAAHLKAKGCAVSVVAEPAVAGAIRIAYPVPDPPPRVSVIIPIRDRPRLLARCVNGLLHRTDYPALEVIIVDNDSRERTTARLLARLGKDPRVRKLPFPGPFNWSALNNAAVGESNADIVVLLNNDIDVISPGWLREMVSHAVRPDIGIVGAKLLYPDSTVQHAGIVLGPAAAARHLMRHAERDDPGYRGMLKLTRTVSAVTGACMAMRRRVFQEAGGLEETRLSVGYNDIDLCLRVRAKGYRVLFAPNAELFHLEAASRGLDLSPEKQRRAREEQSYMIGRWGDLVEHDPFLNRNLCVVNERLALAPPAFWA